MEVVDVVVAVVVCGIGDIVEGYELAIAFIVVEIYFNIFVIGSAITDSVDRDKG